MRVYNKMVICLWIIISLTLEPLEKVAQGLFIQIRSVRKEDVKAVWLFFFFHKKSKYGTDEQSSSTEVWSPVPM